jgi:glycosyltransferase involved in cell wall biosynthesis
MRVAWISRDWGLRQRFDGSEIKTPGGSGYHRCILPAQGLSEFGGIETGCFADATVRPSGEIVPLDDNRWIMPGDWDIVVLQRWMQPEIAEITSRARAAGQIVIQDVDDHFWALHRANAAFYVTDPSHNESWNREHYAEALRAASLVTVSTPFLAEVIKTELGQPNVTVLSNMIDLANWHRQPVRREVKTIGWVGVTSHRSQDLEQMGSAIRYFLRDHKDVTFIHGGHHVDNPQVAKILGIPKSRTQARPMMPIEHYPRLWQGIDTALCPLNPIDFNVAKSALKGMEASAAGVPFVASPLPEYERYGQGRFATTPEQWSDNLDDLMDYGVRQDLADRAHERVQAEDVGMRWADWLVAYQTVVDSALTRA